MAVYYNDNDPKACAWLRELIAAGELPAGVVDQRSICDVQATDLAEYDQCHLFAGIGGWALALRWAGLEGVPGIWTGSCPCQPFSCAGKRRGETDARHLWPAFYALIAERRPATVFGEQVASPDGREWLAGIRLDLEGLGYACGGADLCAAGVGAPHQRQRLFWVADSGRVCRGAGIGRTDRAAAEGGQPHDHPVIAGGRTGWVGNAYGARRAEHRGEPFRVAPAVRLGDSASGGCGVGGDAAQPGHGGHADRAGWAGVATGGVVNAGHGAGCALHGEQRHQDDTRLGQSSAWGDCDILPCRDGKARRVEAGTFPLADGVPGRVGLLRGYGNALVPQVAAVFMTAWYEAWREEEA